MIVNKSYEMLIAAIICSIVALHGCVSGNHFGAILPQSTEGVYKNSSMSVEMTLPSGWLFEDNHMGTISLTKEGWGLNRIVLENVAEGESLPNSHRSINGRMLSLEAANAVIEEEMCNSEISGYSLLSSKPIVFGGERGFCIEYEYYISSVKYHAMYSGCIHDNKLYGLRYCAPERHYFSASLESYAAAVRTFHFFKKI